MVVQVSAGMPPAWPHCGWNRMWVPLVRGWAPLPSATLGVVQEQVLNVFQNLVEELLTRLHAIQVH